MQKNPFVNISTPHWRIQFIDSFSVSSMIAREPKWSASTRGVPSKEVNEARNKIRSIGNAVDAVDGGSTIDLSKVMAVLRKEKAVD